ncbi:MAG: cytochrome P450 [Pseudomonadota bacterium]
MAETTTAAANTAIFTESPELDDAIVSSLFWSDEARIHEQLRWLRTNDPLRYLEPNGFEPLWCVTKYDDVRTIELNKTGFINDPRPTLAPSLVTATIQHMSGRKHLVRSLVQMDDPDHFEYRRLTQAWFMGRNLRKLQQRVDELAKQYVDRLAELGGECDFVKDVAIWYPLRVIMSIFGVPEQDEPLMMKLTQELFGSDDPDINRSFELSDFVEVVKDFEQYFADLSAARRANPTDDVATVIANAKIHGEPIPELEMNGYYMIIATAGHDTTSSSTAGGLLALLQNPEQFDALKADPDGLMATAVDEMIRWVSPVRHFMRTATEDYELRGKTIKAGQSLILWYPSANRDEEVFSDPFDFRVDRKDGKQIAFGYGAHVCLGQHLARMEIAALYRALLKRVDRIELAGEPRYTQSTFVGGLKSLPIRYTLK